MLEYTGIRVRDLDRARAFYCEGLGFTVGRSGRTAAGGVWQELQDPESGAILELNFYPGDPPYREGDELDHLGFRVVDLDAVLARLVRLGARVRIPIFVEGNSRNAFLSDPDGVWVELQEDLRDDLPPASREGS